MKETGTEDERNRDQEIRQRSSSRKFDRVCFIHRIEDRPRPGQTAVQTDGGKCPLVQSCKDKRKLFRYKRRDHCSFQRRLESLFWSQVISVKERYSKPICPTVCHHRVFRGRHHPLVIAKINNRCSEEPHQIQELNVLVIKQKPYSTKQIIKNFYLGQFPSSYLAFFKGLAMKDNIFTISIFLLQYYVGNIITRIPIVKHVPRLHTTGVLQNSQGYS